VQQLRYFLAVAEELHFTRAAARLLITTSSLSQQIALLERRLGTPLFRRTSRSVELAGAGESLLPVARRAVEALDEVTRWSDERRTTGERLRAGLPVSFRLTAKIFATVTDDLPGVDLEVHRIGFSVSGAVAALRNGDIDVAVVPALRRPRAKDIRVVPLWSEQRVLIVGSGHRFADRPDIRLEETNGERFISFGDPTASSDWLGSPRADGSVPHSVRSAESFEEVLDLCCAGLAVHIAGADLAHSHARVDARFVPINDVPDVTAYLLRLRQSPSPAPAAFERAAAKVLRASQSARQ
jgi:DNA-binding transcriptional LysR family regulator